MTGSRLLAPVLLAAAASVTALVPTAQAQPQETGIGIGLAEAPVARRSDPRARVSVIDHVRPGTRLTRRLRVQNDTDAAVDLQLYPAPARLDDGGFVVLERGAESPLTRWASVEPARLRLEARATAEPLLTIVVPADAPDGEYYGAAMAEAPPRAEPGASIAVATRVGVRIYLSVGEGGEPRSDFEISTVTAGRDADGRPTVAASVRNTGERALDMQGALRLAEGPGGSTAGPFPVEVGTTLAPGATAPVLATLDPALPRGPWLVRLALSSGTLARSAEAVVTFPDPTERGIAGPAVPASSVEDEDDDEADRGVAVPLAVAALALVAAGLLWFVLRRRRRAEDDR